MLVVTITGFTTLFIVKASYLFYWWIENFESVSLLAHHLALMYIYSIDSTRIVMLKMEPLLQDTQNRGHLDKQDTFGCPKHPVCVHYNP